MAQITIHQCDGNGKRPCENKIYSELDGILLEGSIVNAKNNQVIVGQSNNAPRDGTRRAICKKCFADLFPYMMTERVVEKRIEVPVTKIEYRTEYVERDSYGGSGRASGPLLPPELPKGVRSVVGLVRATARTG